MTLASALLTIWLAFYKEHVHLCVLVSPCQPQWQLLRKTLQGNQKSSAVLAILL